MKKALIVITIIFLSTVLIPLISLYSSSSNPNNQAEISQQETTAKNELVTIFNESIS